MAENPYERRGRGGGMDGEVSMSVAYPGAPPAPPTIRLEDLDALASSVLYRGREEGRIEAARRYEERLRRLRREAWDEGRAVGVTDGWSALVRTLDERFGEQARGLIASAGLVVTRAHEADDLREKLEEAVRLLERLVEAHHESFREPQFVRMVKGRE